MAESKEKGNLIMTINVKLNATTTISVPIDPNWNVGRLKQEISKRKSINVEEINILFQGRKIHDTMTIQHCGLGNNSVLHMTKGVPISVDATVPEGDYESNIMPASIRDIPDQYKSQFYVFCKSQCDEVTTGKIRVRCKKCQWGGFEVDRDPGDWDDVLLPGQMSGKCSSEEGCDGKFAEFYFKCKAHDTDEQETSAVLNLIKPNPTNIPCLTCFEDEKNPIVVWPCDKQHVMCLQCFKEYGVVKLNERSFIQRKDVGYTLACPAPDCKDSFVKEPHHFHLLGKRDYERYHNFATEEYVLNVGGVLCPKADCCAPIIPDGCDLKIRCQCGYIFCKTCKEAYHNGDCDNIPESTTERIGDGNGRFDNIDVERANQAARRLIKESTRPCPKCKTPTEKNGGCMHMTCKCLFHWCWICQTKWGKGCKSDHWFG